MSPSLPLELDMAVPPFSADARWTDDLALHVPRGGSGSGGSPPAAPPGKVETGDDTALETRPKTESPKRYKVIFHNDDFTTMEFVVDVLRRHFHKNEAEAVHVMLTVHRKGKAVAGVYTRDVAETKIAEVTKDARAHGMPLLLTSEPE
jgi:ATP-dependent Clp protease adaptor protein ClpS